jgi:lysozyme family protein
MLSRCIVAALLLALFAGGVRADPENFPPSVANVLVSEGGAACTNNPADPGGWTKYGVTLKDVRSYVKPAAVGADVCALTEDQARKIYDGKYWLHRCVRSDLLPAGLDYSLFDYGVNAGVLRAGVVLRRIMRVNDERCDVSDGVMLKVLSKDQIELIRAIAAERRQFYGNLIAAKPALAVFRNGWMNRAGAVERISLKMAGAPPLGLFGEELEAAPAFGPGKAWQ